MAAQLFYSSPNGGSESMELMYLLAITAAERSIYLSSAYFVPDDLTNDALTKALKRGVTVQIITPGKYMDRKIVRGASRSRWGELLAAGAEMYEYEPTMYHCKVFIVDQLLVSVGSTNWDPRSFGLNDEANLNIYDADFARRQVEVFRQDLTKSRRVTLAQWRARPFRATRSRAQEAADRRLRRDRRPSARWCRLRRRAPSPRPRSCTPPAKGDRGGRRDDRNAGWCERDQHRGDRCTADRGCDAAPVGELRSEQRDEERSECAVEAERRRIADRRACKRADRSSPDPGDPERCSDTE